MVERCKLNLVESFPTMTKTDIVTGHAFLDAFLGKSDQYIAQSSILREFLFPLTDIHWLTQLDNKSLSEHFPVELAIILWIHTDHNASFSFVISPIYHAHLHPYTSITAPSEFSNKCEAIKEEGKSRPVSKWGGMDFGLRGSAFSCSIKKCFR